MSRTFFLARPPARAFVVLASVAVVLPMAVVGAAAISVDQDLQFALWFVLAVSVVLFVLVALSMARNKVVVSEQRVEIHAGFSVARIARDQIEPGSVSIYDSRLTGVVFRDAGIGLPGARLGWFRARGGERVFLAETTGKGVEFFDRSGRRYRLDLADTSQALVREIIGQECTS